MLMAEPRRVTEAPIPLRLCVVDEDFIANVGEHIVNLCECSTPSKTAVFKVGLRAAKTLLEQDNTAWKAVIFAAVIYGQNDKLPNPKPMSFRLNAEYQNLMNWLGETIKELAIEDTPDLKCYLHSRINDVLLFRFVLRILTPEAVGYAGDDLVKECAKLVQIELQGTRGQF